MHVFPQCNATQGLAEAGSRRSLRVKVARGPRTVESGWLDDGELNAWEAVVVLATFHPCRRANRHHCCRRPEGVCYRFRRYAACEP